jgi:hypothetical protein
MKKSARLRGTALIVLLALAACLGCGNGGTDQFLPSENVSRKALETALTAWQNCQPMDQVGSASPAIQVAEPRWKAGQKLGGYEIVKEDNEDGHTYYSVKLKLKGAAREPLVRYVVVGKDPLWVYNEEEFKGKGGM